MTTGNQNPKKEPDDWRKDLTIPVWPTYGKIVKLSRNKAYESVRVGDVESIKVCGSIRVLVQPLLRKLEGKAAQEPAQKKDA
jgi:hypothetical protein